MSFLKVSSFFFVTFQTHGYFFILSNVDIFQMLEWNILIFCCKQIYCILSKYILLNSYILTRFLQPC